LTGLSSHTEDARRLAALRIGLFGLLAYRLAVVDYGFVADQPAALFDPVSLFHLLNAMPSAELTSVAQPLAVLAALLAAAGAVPRLTMPLALALAVFLNLMLNSTGQDRPQRRPPGALPAAPGGRACGGLPCYH